MINWFKNMLSTSDVTSCMRFCVVMVVLTIMFNYTFLNVVGFLTKGSTVDMSVQDIIALLGMLVMKLGQKKMEKTNGG